MNQQVHQELLEVMKSRRGPYASLAEELFTPEEAEVNNALSRKPSTANDISGKMNRDEDEIREILEKMADKGLCATFTSNDVRFYQGVPFMPGIFEYQFIPGGETERDKKIAELIHEYKKAYMAAKGVTKIDYPVTRVIPVNKTVKAGNTVHTYDQVTTYIEKYDTIGVGTCYCRQAAKLRGEDIHDMPLDVCLWFGKIADYMIERLAESD
ncbi:hypothetical protein QUF72_13125 [Desulfobacterales bacterium HSG2]|nr:hypothetical protein [Desulfobacterales bacterium HSG2]